MKLYRKLLRYLASKELKSIANKYPLSKEELITTMDLMAIQCINSETKGKDRMLSIALSTVEQLEPTTWDKIVADYEDLIDSWYVDREGKEYKFFALAHCKEDYYYALAPSGGDDMVLVSCVANLENMGYTKL